MGSSVVLQFYLTKDVEKWGSGLKRIYDECRENGVEVRFNALDSGFATTFIRTRKTELSPKTSEKTSEKIIEIMKRNPYITIQQLARELDKTTRNIEMQIAKLKKENKIERIGPPKGGHWEIIDKTE